MAADSFGRVAGDHPQLAKQLHMYLNFVFLLIGEPLKQRKKEKNL